MVDVVDAVPTGSFVVVVEVEEGVAPRAVVGGAACFFPQSVLAASARFSFGWEDTYSPWLRALAQVTTLAAAADAFVVVVVVLEVVVDVPSPMTITPTMVGEEVVSAVAEAPLSPKSPTAVVTTAVRTRVRVRMFMMLL